MGDQAEKSQLLNTNKQTDSQRLLVNPQLAHAAHRELAQASNNVEAKLADKSDNIFANLGNRLANLQKFNSDMWALNWKLTPARYLYQHREQIAAGFGTQTEKTAKETMLDTANNLVQKSKRVENAAKLGAQAGVPFGKDGSSLAAKTLAIRESSIINMENFNNDLSALNWKFTPIRMACEQIGKDLQLIKQKGIVATYTDKYQHGVQQGQSLIEKTKHLKPQEVGASAAVMCTLIADPELGLFGKVQQLRKAFKLSESASMLSHAAGAVSKPVQSLEWLKKAESVKIAPHSVPKIKSEVPPMPGAADKNIVAPVGNHKNALEQTGTQASLEHTNPSQDRIKPQEPYKRATREDELSESQYQAGLKQLAFLKHPILPEIEPAKFWRTKMADGKQMMLIPIDHVANSEMIQKLFNCDASHYLFDHQSHLDLVEQGGKRFYALTGPAKHLNHFESIVKDLVPGTQDAQRALDTDREMMQKLAHDSSIIHPPADSPLNLWRSKAEGGLQSMAIPANSATKGIIEQEFHACADLKNVKLTPTNYNGQDFLELVAPKTTVDNFEKQLARNPQLGQQLKKTQEALDKKIALMAQEYRDKVAQGKAASVSPLELHNVQ